MQPWKRRLLVVGIFLAVIGGAAFVFLRTTGFAPGYAGLRTFTDDASGLMDGTQVRLNGIPIGYLETQKLTNSRDPMRKVELDLKVKTAYLARIPSDSVVGLQSDNLLGDLYIAIHRGQSPQPIQANAELRTTQAQDIGKLMARMSQELDRLQSIAERADKLLSGASAGHGSAGKIANDKNLQAAAGISAQIDAILAEAQHGHGSIAKLLYEDPLSVQLQSPMKRFDDIMAAANNRTTQAKGLTTELNLLTRDFATLQAELSSGKGSFGKVNALQQRFDALAVKWDGMMSRITSGQGTLGQFMVNPQLNEALAGATRELQELAKGLKTNPKKFVKLKIF
uniref:Mammalian cell entry related domain protein n=1 Tax=Solibacter usitatus (strain Ellin6076) TaxID=234267 RepID=Q01T55_SOLUE